MQYSIPLGPGKYILAQPKDEDGVALSGGSGTVTFYDDATGEDLTGALAITWNAAKLRYQASIPDQSVVPREIGDLWRGEILIDATTPSAKRFRDILKVRVRAPSSEI